MRRVIVAIAVAAVVALFWLSARSDGASIWESVERGDLVVRLDVEGTLAAVNSDVLSPPQIRHHWEYKIARMASDGSDIREGDAALTFDTSELERLLLEMRAALETAEKEIEKKRTDTLVRRRADELRLAEARANLDKAALKLERPEQFVAAKEIATLELDRRLASEEVSYLEERKRLLDDADEIELSILESQRMQAAIRVRELEDGIERMTLRAPRDGTVVHVTDRRGEKKRVGDSVWRRNKVIEIPDLSRMMARGIVDEADSGRLAVGQRVELTLDAYPDKTFGGSISKIGKTIQPKTRNSPLRIVRIEIALDETDVSRMRPEMRFRGTIEVDRREDVLLVPAGAIRSGPDGAIVTRKSITGDEDVVVTLGRRNQESVEIVDGLSESDEVLRAR